MSDPTDLYRAAVALLYEERRMNRCDEADIDKATAALARIINRRAPRSETTKLDEKA